MDRCGILTADENNTDQLVGELYQGASEHFVLKADITAVSTPHHLNSAGRGGVTV